MQASHWPAHAARYTAPQAKQRGHVLEKLNEFSESTAVSSKLSPPAYRVLGDSMPSGFGRQFKFPFTGKP